MACGGMRCGVGWDEGRVGVGGLVGGVVGDRREGTINFIMISVIYLWADPYSVRHKRASTHLERISACFGKNQCMLPISFWSACF